MDLSNNNSYCSEILSGPLPIGLKLIFRRPYSHFSHEGILESGSKPETMQY